VRIFASRDTTSRYYCHWEGEAVRSLLAVMAGAVMLCGCAQTARQLATTASDNFIKCNADNKATPEGKMLAARLWQFDGNDTAEKLNDPKPLTPTERNALVQVHDRAVKCRQIIIVYNDTYAAWEAPYFQAFFQRADQIFYKLAGGEMPVGVANKLIIESNGQFQADFSKGRAEAVRADEAQRQRAAELLLQANALRAAQPQPQVTPMPQIQMPRMTTTNCFWAGNNLNCTSM
jgi:hypothetical protein